MPAPCAHAVRLAVVAVGLASALALASAAEAKVWFQQLGGTTLRSGHAVTATIAGCPGNDACRRFVEGTEVFLRRGRSRPIAEREPGLLAIGRVDRNGRLRIVVPSGTAGDHHLVALVSTDAGARWATISATFHVRAAGGHPTRSCHAGNGTFDANSADAGFADAFADSRNVVVGPLAMVGAARKPAATIRLGGDKLPVLVEAGHRVTIEVPPAHRDHGQLFFGRGGILTQTKVRDGQSTVTFVACPPRTKDRPGARRVSWWMGFLLADRAQCLPLDVRVDDRARAHRVVLALGRRCP